MTNYSKFLSQIINYLNNHLSNTDRHRLEQEINADPFLSDALDGFSKLTPNELQHDLAALTSQLAARTKPQSNRRLYTYAAIAASLVLFLGIGILYHNYESSNTQLALKKALPKPIKEEEVKAKPAPTDTLVASSAMPKPDTTTQPIKPKPKTNDLLARRSRPKKANTPPASAPSASIELKGRVKSDQDSLPLPGVTILVKGSTEGTITDFDGEYALHVKPSDTLVYSFLGYTEKEIAASEATETTADIALTTNSTAYEEVVVVGYGTQKKKNSTSDKNIVSGIDILQDNESARVARSAEPTIAIQPNLKQTSPAYLPKGGLEKFNQYIKTNKRITPNPTLEIEVELTITPNGQVDHIRFLTTASEAVQTEITHLLTNGPTWHPTTPEPSNNKVTTTIKL